MKNKILSFIGISILVILLIILTGCSNNNDSKEEENKVPRIAMLST